MLEDTISQVAHCGNVCSAEEDHLDPPPTRFNQQHTLRTKRLPWFKMPSLSHRVQAVYHWLELEYPLFGMNGNCAGLGGELNRIRP
jgi:hypothetical protein